MSATTANIRIANTDMAAAWDGEEGARWTQNWQRYESAAPAYHERLNAAVATAPGERVLDVGCGTGKATRDAARASETGAVLGVDLSSAMLGKARELAAAEGLSNVRFEQADAQVHAFDAEAYDVVLSEMGGMFFGDPVAAYRNLRRALRPGGRLVLSAWRGLDANEWVRTIFTTLAPGRDVPSPPPGVPSPFSLADPDYARAMLTEAGYEDIGLEAVDDPFYAGRDADDAYAFISELGIVHGLLHDQDEQDQEHALADLRSVLAGHATPAGVFLQAAGWIISARRPR
jgi:SAM-dependent methyltransferase